MGLLANGITHGQAVALVLLGIFLIIFLIVDIYLVLFLRRKNKKLAKSKQSESHYGQEENYSKENNEFTEIK